MIEYVIVALASFISAYIFMELKPLTKMSVKKALKIVNHERLVMEIPKLLENHGWKYIVSVGEGEQNIRGLVVKDYYRMDKKTNRRRRIAEVKLIDNPKKKDWEYLDWYDKQRRKVEDILLADGTVIVPLSKVPNKYDRPEEIAWHLVPPERVEYWRREAEAANAIRDEYYSLRDRHEKLQNEYERLRNKLNNVSGMLNDTKRELSLKEEWVIELEARLMRLKEEVNGLKNQIAVATSNLEEIVKNARMDGMEIMAEKINRSLEITKSIYGKIPAIEKKIEEAREMSSEKKTEVR